MRACSGDAGSPRPADRIGLRGDVDLPDGARAVGGHQSRNSLPVRVMNTVSRVGSATDRSATSNPWLSAADTTRGRSRPAAPHVQLERPVGAAGREPPVEVALEDRGQQLLVAGGLHRHDGVGADALL